MTYSSDPLLQELTHLREEAAVLRKQAAELSLELAQIRHERRSLLNEFDYCDLTFTADLHPIHGGNLQHIFGMILRDEHLPDRFAPESRSYFSRLWDIYRFMVAAPDRQGETGWQKFTCQNQPLMDFTRWRAFGAGDWQCTQTEAQVVAALPRQNEYFLCSPEPLLPPRSDFRISYTAWADETPCDLTVVTGTPLIMRDTGRELLQDPSDNSYSFAFGAYSNSYTLLQRSLRTLKTNAEIVIIPGKKHHCVAEQIGGRLRMTIDGVQAFETIDLTPLAFPKGRYVSFYSFRPKHHFTDLTLWLRDSSLTPAEWQAVDACRRQTLKYIHGGRDRYFDSRVVDVRGSYEGQVIHLFLKEVTETVTEHLAMERHRQAEEALRNANAALEDRIAARTHELNQALEKFRASEQRFALAALGSHDGLWDWNLETSTVHFSPRWKEILGYADRDIPNTLEAWYGLVVAEDLSPLKQALEAHFAGGTASFNHEYRMKHRDGSLRWVLTRGAAIRNMEGAPLRIAGSQTDITAQKSTELSLRHDAMHDALTGLPNRATFRLKVAEAMHRRDTAHEGFAILFLDLDGFKAVNDTLGHNVGDQLLIGIARRMEGVVRPGDVVGRLGGDEFVVLLNKVTSKASVDRVAERILESFSQPFAIHGQLITISGSIGIAAGRKQFKTPEEIIRKADSAMYHVKIAKKK